MNKIAYEFFIRTGVTYTRPNKKPNVLKPIAACHAFNALKRSRKMVITHVHIAILLPIPSTNSIKKNSIENSCELETNKQKAVNQCKYIFSTKID